MTEQQAFDVVAAHLLKQKVRCQESMGGGWCLYRNAAGLKCAIGALIPDEEYKPGLEHGRLHAVLDACPSLSRLPFDFLKELQRIHDEGPPSAWGVMLELFASDRGLDTLVLDT